MTQKPINDEFRVDHRGLIEPAFQESMPSIIANRVRDAIVYGHIAAGARLGEADLARDLGVSRGALREALQHLIAEGLLVSIHKRGLFVIEMTPEWVKDMCLARQAVERLAAEQIHQRDPVAGGTELMGIIETMAAAPATRAVGDADIAFHDRLVFLARSPRLTRMHKTLLTETRMHIHARGGSYAGDDGWVTEHHRIAQSFIDRNSRLTDRLLVAHLMDAVHRPTSGMCSA
jgi:DNA-binding GntR family transcriptional regulator